MCYCVVKWTRTRCIFPLRRRDNSGKLGSQVTRWYWKSILRNVAISSQLPDPQDCDGGHKFCGLSRKCVVDLWVRSEHSNIQPLGGGLMVSSNSRFELCDDNTLNVRQPEGCSMVVVNSPKRPCQRHIIQFVLPTRELKAVPTVSASLTEICAEEEFDWLARHPNRACADCQMSEPRGCARKTGSI